MPVKDSSTRRVDGGRPALAPPRRRELLTALTAPPGAPDCCARRRRARGTGPVGLGRRRPPRVDEMGPTGMNLDQAFSTYTDPATRA